MTRITCRVPSSQRPSTAVFVDVTTTFQTMLEAPDFSVPDPQLVFPNRDPLDASRAIRPGELFIRTPLMVTNTSGASRWFEAALIKEGSGSDVVLSNVVIPAGQTVMIPIQGSSLTKFDPAPANDFGDRLRLRGEVAGQVFHCMITVEERAASEHLGVVT